MMTSLSYSFFNALKSLQGVKGQHVLVARVSAQISTSPDLPDPPWTFYSPSSSKPGLCLETCFSSH